MLALARGTPAPVTAAGWRSEEKVAAGSLVWPSCRSSKVIEAWLGRGDSYKCACARTLCDRVESRSVRTRCRCECLERDVMNGVSTASAKAANLSSHSTQG